MENANKVGELQTTVNRLQRRLSEAKAELKRALDSRRQAPKRFKRELCNQVQRRKLLPNVRFRFTKERARELKGKIPVHQA